ncbi:hypothetical protein ES703_89453 [subsurface metagenome]
MTLVEIMAKLRWFPLGPVAGPLEPIKKDDLDKIAKQYGVSVSLEKVGGIIEEETREETRGKAIEGITQSIVTISTDDEEAFRGVVRALVRKYRAPRTTYATLDSSERARRIIVELFDEEDGWL